MASSRFPGKPLKHLLGMPLIGHCYYRTSMVFGPSKTFVATCDHKIANYVKSIKGQVIMTSPKHQRATDRVAESFSIISKKIDFKVDVVVMVQGDEPLIPPYAIKKVLAKFHDPLINIANITSPLQTEKSFADSNNVKVVFDFQENALYFSREAIPSPWRGWKNLPKFMQTGVIAFRPYKLTAFLHMPKTPLEKIESVDMNRLLENGEKIRMVPIKEVTIGVDNKNDLKNAEKLLKKDPTWKKYSRK